jgi:Tol biopolymer transport system component
MKRITLMLVLFNQALAFSQSAIGIFDGAADIGRPQKTGWSKYDASMQQYQMQGGGANIWFNRDEFQFLYKKIKGDFILTANFAFVDTGGNGHKKMGWMVRESLDEAAASMNAVAHGDGLVVLQWRDMRGAYMRDPEGEIFSAKRHVEIIQLERSGKKLIMRIAHPGEPLQEVGSHEMPDLKDTVVAGLFICAHDSDKVEQSRIWNVRIDKPVRNDYHPNPLVKAVPMNGVLGSRLETMNVFDGKRTIVLESKGKLEAPNWMKDGRRLLYNQQGNIYTIAVSGGTPEKLNTGSVMNNNNDHGISFDGKMLAISSHRQGMTGGGSTVYILPVSGGEPKLVTDSTPSYWHGWNPNGKEVAVIGQRNGSKIYNIYKVNTTTKAETPLTQNISDHVDGSEFSPDGKFMYYNSSETGTMQLWRMKPDGSGAEQLTFDEYNNWFPHISPDNKWIVFISFPTNIDPVSHPSYQRVMLRLMPVGGGAPRVIAYLYGGQGTLNVNSWSPDSKHIAFVSNSEKAED